MTIFDSLYVSSSLPSCPSSASAFYGALAELGQAARSVATRERQKRVPSMRIRKLREERRHGRGDVSCSTSGRVHEENSGSESLIVTQETESHTITYFQGNSFSRRHRDNVAQFHADCVTSEGSPVPQSLLSISHTRGCYYDTDEEPPHDGTRNSGTNKLPVRTFRSTAPLASMASNAIFTIESTPLVDRIENFDKLNTKGKVTVSAIVVCGLVAASFVGVKLVQGVHGQISKMTGGDAGGSKEDSGGGSIPYNIVAKGFSTVQGNLGPWSFQDLTLGLAAISKVTEKGPPHPPGQPAEELAKNASFLARAQHWRSMAEASYTSEPASFSLQSQLPESVIVAAEWEPNQETFRPAYVVCIDGPYGAVVLSVRGTSQIVDMLVNSGASADPFLDGKAHGGFANATDKLIEEVVPHLKKAFEEHSKSQKNLKLVIVGHSMGAAVGIMAGLKLKQSSEFPSIECWGFSTPACLTLEVARVCKDFVTSFIAHHDVVPRFSINAVELLRKRICDFDWEGAEKIAHGDDDWSNIRSAAENLRSVQEKQQEVSDSVQQAQEGVGEQVQNMHEKLGSPLCNDNNEDTQEKAEEKREYPSLYPLEGCLCFRPTPQGVASYLRTATMFQNNEVLELTLRSKRQRK